MLAQERAAEKQQSSTNDSVWGPTYRLLTIGLMLTVFGAAFEALAVATALPAITLELGGLELYGWAFSAFLLTRLIGITLSGADIDRQGPQRSFFAGVGLFVFGLLLSGFAPSMEILIIGRSVQGFGSGMIGSVSYAIIARGYPEALKPRMLALSSTAWVVPGLLGPAIAGLVTDFVGWRWVFLGLVPLPLIAAFMAAPAIRGLANKEPSTTAQGWGSVIDSIRLTVGAGLILAGLGASMPFAVGLVGLGAVLGVPALRRLLPEGTLRAAAGLPAAVVSMGLQSLIFFGVDAFVPLALTAVRGQATAFTGLALTAATMTWTAGSWTLDRYASRISRRTFALVGMILIGIGVGLTIMTLWPQVPPAFGIFAWGVAGLGIGLSYTTFSLVVLELAPKGREGASSAALQLADVLGAAFGAGIGGVIVAAYGAQATGAALQVHFIAMMALVLLALVTASRLPGKQAH